MRLTDPPISVSGPGAGFNGIDIAREIRGRSAADAARLISGVLSQARAAAVAAGGDLISRGFGDHSCFGFMQVGFGSLHDRSVPLLFGDVSEGLEHIRKITHTAPGHSATWYAALGRMSDLGVLLDVLNAGDRWIVSLP